MTSTTYEISQKEKSTRKRWLFATWTYSVLYPLFAYALLALTYEQGQITEGELYAPLVMTFFGLIGVWITWYFAHRKYGSGLLTFLLVIGPCLLFLSFGKLLKLFFNLETALDSLLHLAIYAWWYFLSLKVLKMNKKHQALKWLSKEDSPAFFERVSDLKNATTLESLDEKLATITKKWPRMEPVSYAEYLSRRAELLKNS